MKVLVTEKLSEHKYKTPEGYLICVDAVLARTGKQSYMRSELFDTDDETEVDVDRRPEEVFSPETLASFENKPVTKNHPDEDVNSENIKEYSVGFVRDVHKGYDNGQPVILGTLVIQDEDTIKEIENGEYTQLSCGYNCDIVDEENPQQKCIRGNHIALCEQGRAGNARIVDSKMKKDELFALEELRKMRIGTYNGTDVYKINSKFSTNPNTSKERFDTFEEVKKYIDNGFRSSIKDVEPRADEDKDEFISRFMRETKEEYPDEKQRLAIAYSYWNKKSAKDIVGERISKGQNIDFKKDSCKDANRKLEEIKEYFKNWGYPTRRELQEVVNFYKLTKNDMKILFENQYDNNDLNRLKYFDSIKDSKYIVHFKHKNGGEDKDIIVEAKGMTEAVEMAKIYVSDYYYKYVNVKPYFEDSIKTKYTPNVYKFSSYKIVEKLPNGYGVTQTEDDDLFYVFYRNGDVIGNKSYWNKNEAIEAAKKMKDSVKDDYFGKPGRKFTIGENSKKDSYKDYQSTKESFERIEEMPRTARKWVAETDNKKAGLLAIKNGIEDIINAAEPSITNELRRKGDKILQDLKTQFKIEDEESTYTEVTKELEKNYDNFAKDSIKDSKLTLDQIINIYKVLKKNK